jgi:hypothetical protein
VIESTTSLAFCVNDPVRFNTTILHRNPYWMRQIEAAESVVHYRDTIIYSGNAVGKDYLVAGLIPWWLWTRENSLVIVTAPSQALLGSVTWKELRKAIKSARVPLDARISPGLKTSPLVLDLGNGWSALGYSTDCVERASGQHAGELLVVAEEASGLESHAWEAIDSFGYRRLIAIGNPIRPDGRFVDLIRQAERDQREGIAPELSVNAIQIPSTDSPHADWVHSPWGLADKTWIEASLRRYGKESLWCASHIFARIPSAGQDTLLVEAWLDAATHAVRGAVHAGDPRAGKPRLAIDLAEGVGRSKTCLLVRDDLGILEVSASNTMGLSEAATEARRLAIKWHVPHDRISYDCLGIGKDFDNHLRRVQILGAKPYAGSGRPRLPKQFVNLRTEGAWTMKHRLDPTWVPDPVHPQAKLPIFHIPAGPWWPEMREELMALDYGLVGDRQTRLVDKQELMDRLGRSPDLADALIQSFAF